MPIERVEFEFPHEEEGENKFEIEVEGVEGRENVLQKDKEEKDEDKEIKGNKTLTGKKAAVVEVDPEPDLENRKKKKSDNPYH